MRHGAKVAVVVPALNEEASIGKVLEAIPEWVDDIVVGDNGSTDRTVAIAEAHGARVVHASRRGYGSACLAAMDALRDPDIVVFLDADFSDHPERMDRLVDPIARGDADLVIGSRALGQRERGALAPQARYGNIVACALIRLFWGTRFTDLGPFRAARFDSLRRWRMADPDYGWTIEMQIKAVLAGARCIEVPVDYRRRIGRSKVSGTLRGVVGAGYKILSTIFLSALRHRRRMSKGSRERVVLFTRFPEPGNAKTRLIPAHGEAGAADLHRQMTERALSAARGCRAAVEVRFTGADAGLFEEWLLGTSLSPQGEGNLGDRMARALDDAFTAARDRVILIGSDCPELTADIIDAALECLLRADAVLGPATDGGYYLIGFTRVGWTKARRNAFADVEWGESKVFDATQHNLEYAGVSIAAMAPLDDVDRPGDIEAWERASARAQPCEISVIIPVLNEAERIEAAINSARATTAPVEIIVADGGSSDDTIARAEALGARVVTSAPGRARQMNFASAKARGDILLFLHADTLLPGDYATHVRAVLDHGAVLGAFRFSVDESTPALRRMSWWANWRSNWLRCPYGDQALFVRKDTFRELGGYRDLPILEDFDLVRRAAKRGRVRTATGAAITSARRWQRLGVWYAVLRNQLVIAMWYAGIAPDRIARFYRGIETRA